MICMVYVLLEAMHPSEDPAHKLVKICNCKDEKKNNTQTSDFTVVQDTYSHIFGNLRFSIWPNILIFLF